MSEDEEEPDHRRQNYVKRHQKAGLCRYCSRPIQPPYKAVCARHALKKRLQGRPANDPFGEVTRGRKPFMPLEELAGLAAAEEE